MFGVVLAANRIRLDEWAQARMTKGLETECEAVAGRSRGKLMPLSAVSSDRFVPSSRSLGLACRSPTSGQGVQLASVVGFWDFAVIAYGAAERRLLTKVAVRTFARATSLDDRNWAEGGLLLKFTSPLTLVASIWRPCIGHRAYLLIYDTSRNVSAEDVCNSR